MRDDLTPRQQEIIALLERGQSTAQIAQALFISVATVRNHVDGIMTALGAHNRLEAVYLWRQLSNPADRILRFCQRTGISVSPKQEADIRSIIDP